LGKTFNKASVAPIPLRRDGQPVPAIPRGVVSRADVVKLFAMK
jgi:hypothetical protein